MNQTPVSNRLHIAIFGKRNAGKSTLINALTQQDIALVSQVAGTTTDPVYKTMEILPLGPVVIIDTAGIDDDGELGTLRVEKSYDVLRKSDVVIYVVGSDKGIDEFDKSAIEKIKNKNIPIIGVFSKSDLKNLTNEECTEIAKQTKIPWISMSATQGTSAEELKHALSKHVKYDTSDLQLVGDLIKPGDVVVLVTPIDKAAPKGRLILPQQQTIRDIIENDAIAIVTKEYELAETFKLLSKKPALVITDSQAFLKVTADTPKDILLTSFSILFARYKGELTEMVRGINCLKNLKEKDKVLIVEGCTHHKQSDDIGTVKIPRWIRQLSGCEIEFEWASGTQFPKSLDKYAAIVHCGGCMLNNQEMKYRIEMSKQSGVAITNYGMLIAYMQGVLERALEPFPDALMTLEENIYE